ncbi:MAG: hypothetical protein ACI9LN_002444, partial [Saprospiraceae bacterium]
LIPLIVRLFMFTYLFLLNTAFSELNDGWVLYI